jgi:hypothetical protein
MARKPDFFNYNMSLYEVRGLGLGLLLHWPTPLVAVCRQKPAGHHQQPGLGLARRAAVAGAGRLRRRLLV